MGDPLFGAGRVSPGDGGLPPLGAVNAVFGTTTTVIAKPGDERLLCFVINGRVLMRSGKYPDEQAFTSTFAADTITITAHGFLTGEGPYVLTTSTTLPDPLAVATDYWLIRVDANTLQIALSRKDALDGIAIVLTDDGTGTHQLGVDAAEVGAAVTDGHGFIAIGTVAAEMRVMSMPAPDNLTVKMGGAAEYFAYWYV